MISKKFLKHIFLAFFISFITLSPLIVPMVHDTMVSNYMNLDEWMIKFNSADLIVFFVPSHNNPILGNFAHHFYDRISGHTNENVIFLGYVPLLLSFYFMLFLKKDDNSLFWVFCFIFFLILTLRPILHVNGRTEFGILKEIKLPYFVNIIFPMFRAPSRFVIMCNLSLSILSGYSISFILNNKNNLLKNLLICLLVILILIEFYPFPKNYLSYAII